MADQRLVVKLGRATIEMINDRPSRHLTEGLFLTANTRGIMAGELRVQAGPQVEEELRRQGPLLVGNAYVTGPGRLADRGVRVIVHGVTVTSPGDPPRPGNPELALMNGLLSIEDAGVRAVTLPLVNRQLPERQPGDNARSLAATLAGHLRRRSRLDRVIIAGLDPDYLSTVRDRLVELGAHRD